MKNCLILLFLISILLSCNNPDYVAEKAMKLISSGHFNTESESEYHLKFYKELKRNFFGNELRDTYSALNSEIDSLVEYNDEDFFYIKEGFSTYQLLAKKDTVVDLYKLYLKKGVDNEYVEEFKEVLKILKRPIVSENENWFTYLDVDNCPMIIYTYKIRAYPKIKYAQLMIITKEEKQHKIVAFKYLDSKE